MSFRFSIFIPIILSFCISCPRQNETQSSPQLSTFEPKAVYFIGDSITAGFGFHADNLAMTDSWMTLKKCRPPETPDNRCSNNQASASRPHVAYPFQFGAALHAAQASLNQDLTPVFNLAVSGSTPAHWDKNAALVGSYPATDMKPGLLASELDKIPDESLTVLTLGANPLLDRWLYFRFGGITLPTAASALGDAVFGHHPLWKFFNAGVSKVDLHKGVNVDCAKTAADAEACIDWDIKAFNIEAHLTNIYKELLKKGPVLVQKYYRACPWPFADNDPNVGATKAFKGPGHGKPCSPQQSVIAARVTDRINLAIDSAVKQTSEWAAQNSIKYKIAAICPGGGTGSSCTMFDNHQFGVKESWVLSSDTGIHPNELGHHALAQGVLTGACEQLGLFCPQKAARAPTAWPLDQECPLGDESSCVYISVFNNTPNTVGFAVEFDDDKDNRWLLTPPPRINAFETARIAVGRSDEFFMEGDLVITLPNNDIKRLRFECDDHLTPPQLPNLKVGLNHQIAQHFDHVAVFNYVVAPS